MATFQEIQDEIRDMLDIPDEELTDGQRASMDAYLDELARQEAAKVDSFAQFIKLETERAKAFREESQRLSAKARTSENKIAWLKNRYLETMRSNGLKKVAGNVYTLSARASSAVMVDDLDAIKDDPLYVRVETEYKPDKRVIAEALKSGKIVPGCRLQENYSLQVR